MSAISLNLSPLRITGSHGGLELSVDSLLSFECPETGFQSLTSIKLLELLRSGKVWVSRGFGYRLNFTIFFDGQHLNLPNIGDFAKYLRDAPCWSRVSMDPKLEFTCGNGNVDSRPSFCISLQHLMSESTLCQSNGSLPPPPASVQAPANIPCLHLQKIEIVMNFTGRPCNRLGRSTGKSISTFESMAFDGAGNIVKDNCDMNDTPFSMRKGIMSQKTTLNLLQERSDIPDASFQDMSCDSEEIPDDCMELHKFNSGRLLPTSRLELPTQVFSSIDQHLRFEESDNRLERIDRSTPDISAFKKMADFAIRQLIGGRQIKNQPGIKTVKPQLNQTLSNIAPGLWSPGFLQAMSQHSQFLPVVSNTISYSFLRNAQSPSLRRKLATLAKTRTGIFHENTSLDNSADSSGDDDSDTVNTARNLNQIIQGSLWRMMHRSLYDPRNARRLSPAPEPGTHDTGVESDEMIDEDDEYDASQDTLRDSQPHTHDLFSALALEADEFDDLFDEPPEEEEEEEEEYETFEALLDGTQAEEGTFEFEDLFSTRTPRSPSISNEDILDGTSEMDGMDIEMAWQDGSDSCGFGRESRRAEMLLDTCYDRAVETQIASESMLI